MAQGATRRARGEAFVKYLNERLGAKQAIQIVPECGHNDRCVFTTDAVLPIVFPMTSLIAARGGDRPVDVLRRVRRGQEPRFELRRRRIDAAREHAAEERA